MRDEQISPGLRVVVVSTVGEIKGNPPVVTVAEVVKPVDPADSTMFVGDARRWWLNTWWGGPDPLPQMYSAAEIFGIPAFGLRSDSEPSTAVPVTGIQVRRDFEHLGGHLEVLVEIDGQWRTLGEHGSPGWGPSGPISHTFHPAGLRAAPLVER